MAKMMTTIFNWCQLFEELYVCVCSSFNLAVVQIGANSFMVFLILYLNQNYIKELHQTKAYLKNFERPDANKWIIKSMRTCQPKSRKQYAKFGKTAQFRQILKNKSVIKIRLLSLSTFKTSKLRTSMSLYISVKCRESWYSDDILQIFIA